jgi:hypothetical protein
MVSDPYSSPIVCGAGDIGADYLRRICPTWKQPERMGQEAQMDYDYLIAPVKIATRRILTCPRCKQTFVESNPQAHQVHCIPCQDARAAEAEVRKEEKDRARMERYRLARIETRAKTHK